MPPEPVVSHPPMGPPRSSRRWEGTPGAGSTDKKSAGRPPREALGRSRGGLTTKIHLVADRRCRPITWLTSPGQHGDSPRLIPLIEAICGMSRGPGRPRTRPARVLADKAYSSTGNRSYLRGRGIKTVIPVKDDQKANRRRLGSAGGRSPAVDHLRYTQRNTVEPAISKLKGFRAVATRYDKLERIYQGTIDVASIKIWLRNPIQ